MNTGDFPNNDGKNIKTLPKQWFATKYPDVAKEWGDAVDTPIRSGGIVVTGINENFFAGILGHLGSPKEPTVYDRASDRFYTYDSNEGIYIRKSKQQLVLRISKIMKDCADETNGNFPLNSGISCDATPLIYYFGKATYLNGVIEKAKGMLEIQSDFFQTTLEEYIICKNGVLRVADRVLLAFDPKYRRRNKLAVNYDPSAKCTDFIEKLLKPALAEQDINVLQQWSGLCLTGINLSQVILLLRGAAQSGKGTYIRILQGIIGQENFEQLRTEHLGGRFETAEFIGKTVLYGADVKANFLNNASASILKSLTGGDPLNAEIKGVTGRPAIRGHYLVVVTSNSRLTVNLEGDADAYRRRLILIEYAKDENMSVIFNFSEQLLEKEASGVLNWMLDGLDRLKRTGYVINLAPDQKQKIDDLLMESESHTAFVKDCIVRDDSSALIAGDCYDAYSKYCKKRGWPPSPAREASKEITHAILVQFQLSQRNDMPGKNGKDQRGWKGIKVKET